MIGNKDIVFSTRCRGVDISENQSISGSLTEFYRLLL